MTDRITNESSCRWDPLSPAMTEDPAKVWDELREQCPVVRTEAFGGLWAILGYDDIVAAAKDTATFSNEMSRVEVRRPPLESDKPEHTTYRRLLQPYFAPKRMAAIEGDVRSIVRDLLRPLVGAGEVDMAPTFTYPLPVLVLCRFLNLPPQDATQIKAWADEEFQATLSDPPDKQRSEEVAAAVRGYIHEFVESRRAQPLDPATDMVSGLLEARVDGEALTDEQVAGVVRLMLSAGHDSTTSSLGIVLKHLASHPDDQRRLRDEPELIPAAVEELLRHETPVQALYRRVTRDTEFRGNRLGADERVALVWGSGNRDPRTFDDPDEAHLDRRPNPHLVFGRGVHLCLGKPLALLELRVVCEEVLAATTDLHVTGRVQRTGWPRFGVSRLPYRLDPA